MATGLNRVSMAWLIPIAMASACAAAAVEEKDPAGGGEVDAAKPSLGGSGGTGGGASWPSGGAGGVAGVDSGTSSGSGGWDGSIETGGAGGSGSGGAGGSGSGGAGGSGSGGAGGSGSGGSGGNGSSPGGGGEGGEGLVGGAGGTTDGGTIFKPQPPNEGTQCTTQSPKTITDYYGTFTKVDLANNVVHLKTSYAYNWLGKPATLPATLTCNNASFVCGDLKGWSGAVGQGPERYFGAICGVSIIDSKTVAIHLGNNNSKVSYATPKVGDQYVYMHWQACGGTSFMIASCS